MNRDKTSELESGHFDHLLGSKDMLTTAQVATVLQLSDTGVINLADAGKLGCCEFNAAKGVRLTRRFPRELVTTFLLQSKTYAVADYCNGIVRILRTLAEPELRFVVDRVPRLSLQ